MIVSPSEPESLTCTSPYSSQDRVSSLLLLLRLLPSQGHRMEQSSLVDNEVASPVEEVGESRA
jgi:hypothetical protein